MSMKIYSDTDSHTFNDDNEIIIKKCKFEVKEMKKGHSKVEERERERERKKAIG